MEIEEFKKKWDKPPMFSEDFDMFMNDAESVGNIVRYDCQTLGCEFTTMDYNEYKEHGKIQQHPIFSTTVTTVGWRGEHIESR